MRYCCQIIAGVLTLAMFGITGCRSASCDVQREERLVSYYEERINTPSEFRAKMVEDPYWVRRREAIFGGTLGMSKKELRKALTRFEREINIGRNWKTPIPKAKIPFAETAPVIDGNISEDEWSKALIYRGEYLLNSETPQKSKAEWYLMYDRSFIYYGVRIWDNYIKPGPGDAPYKGDSVEIFLHPDKRLADYVETVVSADGTPYNTRAAQSLQRHYDLELITVQQLKSASKQFPGGYSVEVRIPFSALPGYLLGNPPKAGETMNFMMLRCDVDKTGKYTRSTPVPFLYDGHNIYCYIQGILAE